MTARTRASVGERDRPSVLIVDDDAEMRHLLRDALERHGYRVREHGAGDGLVPVLEEAVPDAVVLDKEMTGANGLDILTDLRHRHPDTPVVLVTAFGGSEVRAEALRRGAAHYIDKPFRIAQLLEVLESTVGPGGQRSTSASSEVSNAREVARSIVQEARAHGGLVLLADYEDVLRVSGPDSRHTLPLLVRGALVALATSPSTLVVAMSNLDARDLEIRINVPGVVYAGCQGLEIRGAGMSFSHPLMSQIRVAWPPLRAELLRRIGSASGVDIEMTQIGGTIRAHGSDPRGPAALAVLAEDCVRPVSDVFHVRPSESGVEVLPRTSWRKASAARWVLEQWLMESPNRPAVVYLGDDDADEDIRAAMRERISVVRIRRASGEEPGHYRVADRAAATDVLAQIAFAWGVHSASH